MWNEAYCAGFKLVNCSTVGVKNPLEPSWSWIMFILEMMGLILVVNFVIFSVGAFFTAFLIQWTLRLTKGLKILYWSAYKAFLISATFSLIVGGSIVFGSGDYGIYFALLVSILIQLRVYSKVIEDPRGNPIGLWNAALVSFIQFPILYWTYNNIINFDPI